MDKSVTLDEMREAVIFVYNECGRNLPLEFKIRETPEEIFGYERVADNPEAYQFEGAYFPRRGLVVFTCANVLYPCGSQEGHGENSERQGYTKALEVVRHEVLGHYALNTCSDEKKLNILSKIIECKNEPSLKSTWAYVEKHYSGKSQLIQAEEVFAFIAESKPKLIQSFELSKLPFTFEHVEQISARITEGIQLGERSQQIFPKTDAGQFSNGMHENTLEPANQITYRWNKDDSLLEVQLNGKPISDSFVSRDVVQQLRGQDKFLFNFSYEQIARGSLSFDDVTNGSLPKTLNVDNLGRKVSMQQDLANSSRLSI
ncbi:zeta toxin family protein [Vibrio ichthyoenteri ATCC 700023]|uniref:Zeta toxin family protein n=1 Tax=Vibrio ichthyoenteri ATCC 700023 TaxID=870968 RepID=F9S7K3_9VIBR|nr:hypothetical protein [Vibrio ichthyoenteri]EGU31299.1 zeta toxin family protein [Vibrio ichthyoenteri ATCC 700023]